MTSRLPRAARGLARAGFAVACAALLAACASPPSRFYTLSDDRAPAASTPANPAFLIQVPAVDVPEQIAKNQLVIQKSATQVDVLEQERWAALPADEIRRALSADLTHRLDTIDVADSAYPPGMPVYRVSVNVQRFESWPGRLAAIDAVWSVRSLATQAVMICRTSVTEPVGPGYDALVAGHRAALGQLAARIAQGVRAMAASPAAATAAKAAAVQVRCPADAPSAGQRQAGGPD